MYTLGYGSWYVRLYMKKITNCKNVYIGTFLFQYMKVNIWKNCKQVYVEEEWKTLWKMIHWKKQTSFVNLNTRKQIFDGIQMYMKVYIWKI